MNARLLPCLRAKKVPAGIAMSFETFSKAKEIRQAEKLASLELDGQTHRIGIYQKMKLLWLSSVWRQVDTSVHSLLS